MTTIASIAHLEHAAQLKAVASDLKHDFHQQNNTLPGSAVPRGSAPHLADQAFSQYVDAVSKETGLSKQAIMSVRESGISRGATDAKVVEVLIDQDARERSAWESQTLGGRVKGGVAAEMQSAAAKLHAAIEQASTVDAGATASSATNAVSSENGAVPSVMMMETVDADDLMKHVADVKIVASDVKSQYPTTSSVVPRGSAPQHADQALAHVAEAVAQETTLSKQEVLGIPKGVGEKLPIEVVKEIKEDARALAKEESVEGLVPRGGAAANMQSAVTKLSQVQSAEG